MTAAQRTPCRARAMADDSDLAASAFVTGRHRVAGARIHALHARPRAAMRLSGAGPRCQPRGGWAFALRDGEDPRVQCVVRGARRSDPGRLPGMDLPCHALADDQAENLACAAGPFPRRSAPQCAARRVVQ